MSSGGEPESPIGNIKAGQYLEEPSHLTWTTQKPTASGLYRYRKSQDAKAYVVDVELKDGTLTVDNKYPDRCGGPVASIVGEWAGPLLPPK